MASFLAIQLGRTGWMLTTRVEPRYHDHFRRTLLRLAATARLWIIGAIVPAAIRVAVWGAAAAIDLTGTWLAHPVFAVGLARNAFRDLAGPDPSTSSA